MGIYNMECLPSILLCGYERGGTTLLSEIFAQNGYQSGFEIGVLMCENPREFPNYKPYFDNMIDPWGITIERLTEICATDHFDHFYNNLFLSSKNIKVKTGHDGCIGSNKFYDKTPIYMSELGNCLNKTKAVKKAVVITRDPRAVITSWAKRNTSPQKLDDFIVGNITALSKRYLSYFMGSIAHRKNPNVLFVSFEQLCMEIENYLKVIGIFSEGVPWSRFGAIPRFENVTSNKIDMQKIFEYRGMITPETADLILENTKLASLFFSDVSESILYKEEWSTVSDRINAVLTKNNITEISYEINHRYFEPETYLLKNRDVLDAEVNPIEHFHSFGISEGRSGF